MDIQFAEAFAGIHRAKLPSRSTKGLEHQALRLAISTTAACGDGQILWIFETVIAGIKNKLNVPSAGFGLARRSLLQTGRPDLAKRFCSLSVTRRVIAHPTPACPRRSSKQ